jgi:hypothetical protein
VLLLVLVFTVEGLAALEVGGNIAAVALAVTILSVFTISRDPLAVGSILMQVALRLFIRLVAPPTCAYGSKIVSIYRTKIKS